MRKGRGGWGRRGGLGGGWVECSQVQRVVKVGQRKVWGGYTG